MRSICLLFCFLICINLCSQATEWTHYRNFDGVTCHVQQGDYIWLGTTNNGLIKFNRHTKEAVYDETYNNLKKMKADSQGRIWMLGQDGYEPGIICYQDENWTFYNANTINNQLQNITDFCIDSNDNVWIIYGYLLLKFNGTTWTQFTNDDLGLPGANQFYHICSDMFGNIWFNYSCFSAEGVVKFNGTTSTVYNTDNSGISYNGVWDIISDDLGKVWVIHGSTCSIYNNDTWTVITYSSDTIDGLPLCLACDSEGNYWFGLSNGRVSKYDGTVFFTYNSSNSVLSSSEVLSISVDADGKPWASYSRGLYNINSSNVWEHSNPGIPEGPISCIAIDNNDCMWFMSTNGGLTKFDGLLFESVTTNGLPSGRINNLAFDNNDVLWATTISTNGFGNNNFSLSYLTNGNWTNYNLNGNNNGIASCLEIDSQNNKWVGTQFGLLKTYEDTTTLYTIDNSGVMSNNVTCVGFDNLNRTWVGAWNGTYHYGGYSMFNGTSWFEYPTNNEVLSIETDPVGNIWIGCDHDMVHFCNENADTLHISHVTDMCLDYNGYVWLLSKDLYPFSLRCLHNGNVSAFNAQNSGLKYRPLCITIDSANNKWVGTQQGLYKFSGTGTTNNDNYQTPVCISVSSYPNPFNTSATIEYKLSSQENVQIAIYDIKGRKIKSLYSAKQTEGKHSISWDGTDQNKKNATSGVYLCTVAVGKTKQICKLIHIK